MVGGNRTSSAGWRCAASPSPRSALGKLWGQLGDQLGRARPSLQPPTTQRASRVDRGRRQRDTGRTTGAWSAVPGGSIHQADDRGRTPPMAEGNVSKSTNSPVRHPRAASSSHSDSSTSQASSRTRASTSRWSSGTGSCVRSLGCQWCQKCARLRASSAGGRLRRRGGAGSRRRRGGRGIASRRDRGTGMTLTGPWRAGQWGKVPDGRGHDTAWKGEQTGLRYALGSGRFWPRDETGLGRRAGHDGNVGGSTARADGRSIAPRVPCRGELFCGVEVCSMLDWNVSMPGTAKRSTSSAAGGACRNKNVCVGQRYQDLDPRRPDRIGTVVEVGRNQVRIRWDSSGHTTTVRRVHLDACGSRGYVLIGERKAPG